jgi:DNA-binding CsgD family transcriptional regulator
MLLGRDVERARLAKLLDEAREGRSSALVIRGEPGIGKSALLDAAIAGAAGMTVLHARGVESESELSFAGLADLLHPVLDELGQLPVPQSGALAGALALGPPVAGDRFTVYAAALTLLAAASDRRPLLAVVDDAPWMDAPSREALVFVARRLHEEGIVMLLAARTGEPIGTELAGVPELVLEGLDRAASAALLARGTAGPIAPAVAERLFDATHGNPLALLELSALLSDGQRAGTEPIEDPPVVGSDVERAFGRQLDALPAATRHALLVAAACETGAGGEIAAALASLGLDAGELEAAERTGLIAIPDGVVRFRHPVLRSLAYRALPAPDRRAAHRALAEVLAGDRLVERRAWHLAAATAVADEGVALALAAAAAAARRRGGPAAAMLASERAAQLTPDAHTRAQRLLEAADDVARVGRADRALALLGEALDLAPEPLLRADIQHRRALIEARGGDVKRSVQLLVEEASLVAPRDPVRAVTMMTAVVQPCFEAGQNAIGLAIAERAHALAAEVGLGDMPTGLPLAMALLLCGQRPEAEPLLRRAADWLDEADDPWALGPVLVFGLGQAFVWLGEYERARGLLGGGIEQARAWSAPALLPYGLLALSELDFRTGRWPSAYAAAAEGAQLAEQTGQVNDQGYSLAMLARVEAALGREDDCRSHLAHTNRIVDRLGTDIMRSFTGTVAGFLELGFGRGEEAVAELEDVAAFLGERPPGDPGVLQWAPDLIEAYVRVGRHDDGCAALDGFEHHARRSGGAWGLATAARCHGLLAGDDGFETHFETALAHHDTPFEAARTHLCLGERLRRAGRRVESRARLRAALDVFERLGAQPWAERARAELRASGQRVQRRPPAPTVDLTPQELQVALAIARGATNREAAARLFLSPKTIEFHLRNIYRKLGIRSRTELVRRVLSGAQDPAAQGAQRPP